jgi:hypothetical protein
MPLIVVGDIAARMWQERKRATEPREPRTEQRAPSAKFSPAFDRLAIILIYTIFSAAILYILLKQASTSCSLGIEHVSIYPVGMLLEQFSQLGQAARGLSVPLTNIRYPERTFGQ